ncbi:tyrosine-type recombinase/integrase [Halomonas sp. HMF6819]|uniref:tyrosine-type recombinase/integrase n=1 Tax=Halomonas sp. HMF6819 TaxID=3373085 RepID=UPI0037B15ADD
MGITVRYRANRDKWVVTETHNGRRHQCTFDGTKAGKREADEYAAARQVALNDARFNGEVMGRKERRTFLEGVSRWMDEYDVTSQLKAIGPVVEYMGPDVMLGIETVDKGRKMARELKQKGRAQSTINNHVQVVKRVLNLAYREWEWIDQPLGDKLKKPNPKNERHTYPTPGDLKRLLEAIPDRRSEEKIICAVAAVTGLRRGELLGLEPSNYSQGRVLLRANQTKSGKARVVPVPQFAQEWLATMLPFFDGVPRKVAERRVRTAWEDARAAIGKPDLRFHDLRHSYASLLAQSGENMTTVRDLLGHSSLLVTSRYAHMFAGSLDEIGGKMPNFLQPLGEQQQVALERPAITH